MFSSLEIIEQRINNTVIEEPIFIERFINLRQYGSTDNLHEETREIRVVEVESFSNNPRMEEQ